MDVEPAFVAVLCQIQRWALREPYSAPFDSPSPLLCRLATTRAPFIGSSHGMYTGKRKTYIFRNEAQKPAVRSEEVSDGAEGTY